MYMQECLNQFNEVTDLPRSSIQVLQHTNQFSTRNLEELNQIMKEINEMMDKCKDIDTDDDPTNPQSSLFHPPFTSYCEEGVLKRNAK